MDNVKNIDVLFVAGFGPIVRDAGASRRFYAGTLGGGISRKMRVGICIRGSSRG